MEWKAIGPWLNVVVSKLTMLGAVCRDLKTAAGGKQRPLPQVRSTPLAPFSLVGSFLFYVLPMRPPVAEGCTAHSSVPANLYLRLQVCSVENLIVHKQGNNEN
ncbi:unnamed protein product [Urochloa humidicola]